MRAALAQVQSAVPSAQGHPDIEAFRRQALLPEKPLLFRNDAGSPASQLPSLTKWFTKDPTERRGFSVYMDSFQDWPFPYELSSDRENEVAGFRDWLLKSGQTTDFILAGVMEPASGKDGDRGFSQLFGPLRLLNKALEFNSSRRSESLRTLELYIAQSGLEDLPQPLLEDVPTPELVKRAGKGDVYASSLWLGTEPTYTPLHRDPNPNLFCQLCGYKAVRLLPPISGDRLYFEVQAKIRQRGNSRIRTTEMMQGKERQTLHDAVWNRVENWELYEAELGPGDALFITYGWWHSVKSKGTDGQLNGSVNWWFR